MLSTSARHQRYDGARIETYEQRRRFRLEIGKPLPIDRQCVRQVHTLGVLEYAVHTVLVMKMRAGCKSRHPDIGDGFALGDVAADVDAPGEPREVAVHGNDALRVVDLNHIAVAALGSHVTHAASARSVYRCAAGRCVIDTLMSTNKIQNGMHAMQIEA